MKYIEKRKHRRFEFDRDIAALDTQNGTVIGHLENLSLDGMMLSSELPTAIGQEYHVTLSLRTEIDGKSTVNCRVCSIWSGENMWREPDSSKQYCTGYKITSIADTELKTLDVLIKTLSNLSR
ncbi:MAG: PilZ domain-containing protein [Gammaproteobacteria bacterium]|nr:PilZ domain-containing protein [Gammaproteobacteria bacterium]